MIARPGVKYLATPLAPGPNLIETFSVFSKIKCKDVDRLAKGTLSPLYISTVHLVQAAHKPYYHRRYSPKHCGISWQGLCCVSIRTRFESDTYFRAEMSVEHEFR